MPMADDVLPDDVVPGDEVVIELDDIAKTYVVRTKAGVLRRHRREVPAVAGVDLTVRRGEMIGYLGPNGAGKSTTIKMITGILTPTSGRLAVLGLRPVEQRRDLARRIGVVFGQRSQLWWDLPLVESFELLHHVYATDPERHRHNMDEFVDRLDLGAFMDTPVRQLSLGQRMRGELTAALLHDPELVVLDEPTIGLDVVSKHAVREFLADVNAERGATVLLTTHDLDDVAELCERMVVIDHGRLLIDTTVEDFTTTYGTTRRLVVELAADAEPIEVRDGLVVRVEGRRQWIEFDRRVTTAAKLVAEVGATHALKDLSIEEPGIEQLIRRLYEGGVADGPSG